MNNVTIMFIPCGFKIKSKADVERFINECMVKDNEYFLKIHEDFALVLNKDKDGAVAVLEKRWDLYDVFNPLIEVANTSNNGYKKTVHYYIWKYRKYINKEWFND